MARVVFVFSALLLVAVVVASTGRGAGADLRGDEVRSAAAPAAPAAEAFSPAAPTAAWPSLSGPTTTVAPDPPDAAPSPPVRVDPVRSGLAVPPPTHLRIDVLGVDDPVVTVGLEADGSLEIPGPTQVGWYRGSRAPGAPAGSAVLTAHVDYDGEPGVFLELGRLEVGSEVVTVDATGVEHRYEVIERYQVDKDELAIDELFRRDGPHVLTLITCGGFFDEDARHYQDNIVIRAVPR
jgi:LPXTG-site transpeptidase (sortase) family protein